MKDKKTGKRKPPAGKTIMYIAITPKVKELLREEATELGLTLNSHCVVLLNGHASSYAKSR